MYGSYREDGFYLFPLGAYLRIAQMQMHLAANRTGLPLIEVSIPGWPGLALQDPAKPALQNLIKARTAGFAIPTSLPQYLARVITRRRLLAAGRIS